MGEDKTLLEEAHDFLFLDGVRIEPGNFENYFLGQGPSHDRLIAKLADAISAQSAAIKAGEEETRRHMEVGEHWFIKFSVLNDLLEAPSDEVVNAVADAIQKEGETYAIIPGYAYARLARAALSALNKGLET